MLEASTTDGAWRAPGRIQFFIPSPPKAPADASFTASGLEQRGGKSPPEIVCQFRIIGQQPKDVDHQLTSRFPLRPPVLLDNLQGCLERFFMFVLSGQCLSQSQAKPGIVRIPGHCRFAIGDITGLRRLHLSMQGCPQSLRFGLQKPARLKLFHDFLAAVPVTALGVNLPQREPGRFLRLVWALW